MEIDYCFDCGAEPQEAFLDIAVLLCSNCASFHRKGSNTLRLLSSNLSYFEKIFMKRGGNERLKGFMREVGIQEGISREIMYKSKFIEFYKNLV